MVDDDQLEVLYQLRFAGEADEQLIRISRAALAQAPTPAWARLEFAQCAHCPLNASEQPWCPFARALALVLAPLEGRQSFDTVQVSVHWRGRTLQGSNSLQRVLGSLIGLVGGLSGCPHTGWLEPMATFHLPFSGADETLFRVLGTYLLGQFMRSKQGLPADFALEQLPALFHNLHRVNLGLAARMRQAVSTDSGVNALVLLDVLASETLSQFEELEVSLQPVFQHYLS